MRDLVQIPEVLLESLRQLGQEYGFDSSARNPIRPPHAAVEQRILAFGIAEAAKVASLILGAWRLINTRRCTFKGPMTRRCGSAIIVTTYDPANEELIFTCAAGHSIVQRSPRIYR